MSEQATLWDIPSVIGSPALESGVTRSGSQDGPTTVPSGPEVAPVQASRAQVKGAGLMTLVTSGLTGIPSSASAVLQSSLESRLMMLLDSAGSTLFVETWKRRATPLRRRYWEHTARALRTSDSDCTSVPTPQRADMTGGGQAKRALRSHRENGVAQSANLNDFAMLATVATPRSEDSQCAGANRGAPDTLHSQANLATMRHLASRSTPSARDWKDTSGMSESGVDPDGSTRSRLDQLPRQAQLAATGVIATGGTDETVNIGQLDPAYSRWLQGLPPVFCDCAVTAMQSLRPSRKPSSKRI